MNPFDFTPTLVDEYLLTEEIARQLKEDVRMSFFNKAHIVIMRTLWDEMLDKGNQLLPKDVRFLADKLADELEKI